MLEKSFDCGVYNQTMDTVINSYFIRLGTPSIQGCYVVGEGGREIGFK